MSANSYYSNSVRTISVKMCAILSKGCCSMGEFLSLVERVGVYKS